MDSCVRTRIILDTPSSMNYLQVQQNQGHMPEPNVITVTELARERDCSRQTIYNAIVRGDLTTVQLGTQTVILKDKKYRAFEVQEKGSRLLKAQHHKEG